MPKTQAWGGGVTSIYSSGYPGNVVYRDGTGPIPTANVAANGNRPLKIHSCSAVSLSNGSPEIVYQSLGWLAGRVFATSTPGGSFRFQCRNTGGTMQVGRSEPDGGTVVDAGDGDTRTGSIPGSMQWSGVPSAPRTPAASSPEAGEAVVTWTAPSDDGGESITGYRVTRTDDDGTSNPVSFDTGVVLTYTDTTVAPGGKYKYRVFAKNPTASSAGTTSVASSVVSVTVKAGGYRATGSGEIPTSTFVRWNGSSEIPITTAVRWNGSAEVPLS